MGNSMNQRVKSPSSTGLSFYFSYSDNKHTIGFFNQKSNFIPKNSSGVGLTVIFHDNRPLNSISNYIVFPETLLALDILYSAPGELWNWSHPKPRDLRANHTISARDGILIPTNPEEIIRSEEYTCVVSTKDGYPKMTHLYGDAIIDSHPIPASMVSTTVRNGDHHLVYREESSDESIKNCYICRTTYKEMNDISLNK